MINLLVNGRKIALDVEPEMPLLWALRDELGMVGTNSAAARDCAAPAP